MQLEILLVSLVNNIYETNGVTGKKYVFIVSEYIRGLDHNWNELNMSYFTAASCKQDHLIVIAGHAWDKVLPCVVTGCLFNGAVYRGSTSRRFLK